MGVEPTILAVKDRINGFEGHEDHRTLFASVLYKANRLLGLLDVDNTGRSGMPARHGPWIARRLASEADDHHPDMSKWKPTQPYLQQLRGIPFMSSRYNDERLRNLYGMFFAAMKEKEERGITGNDSAFSASVAFSKRHTTGAK